jgi:hypothetical protein
MSFTASHAQTAAVSTNLFGDKVTVIIPAMFNSDSSVNTTTYSLVPEKPSYVFKSSSEKARCLIYYSADSLSDNDVPAFTDLLISKIKGLYASVKIQDDGISLNDGKNIGYIKCTTGKRRHKKSLQCFYGSFNGRLLLFLVDSDVNNDQKLAQATDIMISSLRINDLQ